MLPKKKENKEKKFWLEILGKMKVFDKVLDVLC